MKNNIAAGIFATPARLHLALTLAGGCFLISSICDAQHYSRTDTIPVKANSVQLKMPWVGGHNFCQFSDIDMNLDGIKDLFVFDRTGMKITTYINKGTANTVDYADSTSKYASKFPHMEEWVLLRDYNCDGKNDIFTYGYGSVKVWKNTSSAGDLQFTLESPSLKSAYCPAVLNLALTGVDIPSIDDIDGDGDLDILTYDAGGINMQYHVNKSKELGYGCDSLIFSMDCSGCWGNFRASISGCNMVYGTCRTHGPDSTDVIREGHAGNCSLCMDLDGDGDKEILLGQLGCCNMVMLTNGGSQATANMTAMDDSFPSYNVPAMFNSFPCGYFLDLNNDNRRDLIVSPNAPNVSIDRESIWYYLNSGSDSIPVFNRQTKSLLQKDMIDVGEGADPVFFDFTNDGLTDLLVSNYAAVKDSCPSSNAYGVLAFKNTGSLTSPAFELVSSDYANLSVQLTGVASKHPTFGDLDGDGDADMCIGDFDGFIHYFQNIAAAGNPANFNYISIVIDNSTSNPIDVGNYSTPQLIDIDRDGDLDLIIGERAGNLNYYQNTGTTSAFSFSFVSNTFGGVDVLRSNVTGYSVPFIYDSTGSYRMFVGSESNKAGSTKTGWLWKFRDIDGNLAGNFTLVDSMYQNIWEGLRMTVNGNDINNDGSLDLTIGNYAGGVAIYLGDTTALSVPEPYHAELEFTIFPNPSSGIITLQMQKDPDGKASAVSIYNMLGEEVFTTPLKDRISVRTLDISHLPDGVYCFEVKAKNTSFSKKLVLIR